MADSRLATGPGAGHAAGMLRRLSALGTWLTKIESWLALGAMVIGTGIFAWLGQQWNALAEGGWSAVVIVAFVCSSLVIGATSLGYLAFSQYRERRLGLYGNEHAVALWKDGIPVFRDQYMRYVRSGNYSIVIRFWSAGLIHIADHNGQTDLHIACEVGHAVIVDELIKRGADPNRPDKHGRTPLIYAAAHGQPRVAETLLTYGSAINATAFDGGYSALFAAACHGHQELVDILLRHKADIDRVNKHNLTPLMAALAQRHWKVAGTLLAAGADTSRIDVSGATHMDYAVEHGAPPELIQELSEQCVGVARPKLQKTGGGFGGLANLRVDWRRIDDGEEGIGR